MVDPGARSGSAAPSADAVCRIPRDSARLPAAANTVNLENLVRLIPDPVLDIDNTIATYMSVAEGCIGMTVTSSITNEAVDDLALKVGDDAFAVIKASDVMVAK
jgi:molybdopterin-binding protein